MPPPSAAESLSADIAARLTEFARACKAATRIVSLYPPSHPSIQSGLARIADAGRQVVVNGPFAITVLPDNLLVGGRGAAKADPAIGELAVILHRHQIAELTLNDTLDGNGWHRFLSLLARTPEESRATGGVATAWESGGGGPIGVKEIDYAQVLREGAPSGEAASWDRIISDWLEGPTEGGEQSGFAAMLDIAGDASRLAEFTERLQERSRATGDGPEAERRSLVRLMHGLANYAAQQSAENLDATLHHMAGAAMQLSPDMLLALVTDPPPLSAGRPGLPRVDLAAELQSRLTDESIGKYVSDNVVKDHGATNRLATAFHTLVPGASRQLEVLSHARREAEGSPLGQDPQFENVWSNSMNLLTSYSDKEYVSDDYARELTQARAQAVEVERVGDVPPARIRAWLSTVSDEAIRFLDQRLILDLLAIEQRPDVWAGVLDGGITAIEQMVLAGDLPLALELLESAVAAAERDSSPFAASAAAGLSRLATGPLVKHLAVWLRRAADADVVLATKICQTVGPSLVGPLADALSAEDNARAVRRLRDVLISFGQAARTYANELRGSANPAVRRAAVDLLRALGGDDALPDLRSMLDDAEPQVQREALRAIVQIGTNDAFHLLEDALKTGAARTREAIVQALGSLRDERATPLFVHILTHFGHAGTLEGLYMSSIEALGRLGGGEPAVSVLRTILHRGEWWAPGRTARLRAAAARALRSMATPSAERALQEAADGGSSGVKRVARAALAEAPSPRPGAQRLS